MELKVGDKVRVNAVESNSRMNCVNGTISYIDETNGEYKYFVEVDAFKTIPYSADELDFLERPTPPDSDPFGKILDEMFCLHQKKNADYGDSFTKLYKTFGEPYAFGHIVEKVERLKSLYKNGKLENESVRDSLIDLANYAVMTIVELDNQNRKE